jgi:hypothetical protein
MWPKLKNELVRVICNRAHGLSIFRVVGTCVWERPNTQFVIGHLCLYSSNQFSSPSTELIRY